LLHAYYGWSKLLQMKDDSKNALYIENLTEEYVTSYDDVTQILIKVGTIDASKQIYCWILDVYIVFILYQLS